MTSITTMQFANEGVASARTSAGFSGARSFAPGGDVCPSEKLIVAGVRADRALVTRRDHRAGSLCLASVELAPVSRLEITQGWMKSGAGTGGGGRTP